MRAYRRLIDSNEQLSTAWWHLQAHLAEMRGRESVIVYQMGKVGSTTIVASLHALHQKRQIHHVHTLTQAGIAEQEAFYRHIAQETQGSTFERARHLMSSRYLAQRLHSHAPGQKWKVITLVREPIARNISSFFQTIDFLLPNFLERYQAGELPIEEVTEVFLEQFDHDNVLQWLDRELYAALGIDVYASDFDRERGYHIYQGEHCELLLLKLEKLNECAREAFRDFLGIDNFELVKSNVGDEKEYAEVYQQFKAALSLPESYLQHMYRSRYMQHFYTPNEIAAFRGKWEIRHDALVPTLG